MNSSQKEIDIWFEMYQDGFVHDVWNPVRDGMLVENECHRAIGRAVRHAIFHGTLRPYGTFRALWISFFYQYFVPNGTLTSPTTNYKDFPVI